jgi:hypothetical protein
MKDENVGWANSSPPHDGFWETDVFKTENGGIKWEWKGFFWKLCIKRNIFLPD